MQGLDSVARLTLPSLAPSLNLWDCSHVHWFYFSYIDVFSSEHYFKISDNILCTFLLLAALYNLL